MSDRVIQTSHGRKEVPADVVCMVRFRCENHEASLDAYDGPPYCKLHSCFMRPVMLMMKHPDSERSEGIPFIHQGKQQ